MAFAPVIVKDAMTTSTRNLFSRSPWLRGSTSGRHRICRQLLLLSDRILTYSRCDYVNRHFASAAAPQSNITDDESTRESYGLYRLLTQEERDLLQEQRQLTAASRQLANQIMNTSSTSTSSNLLNSHHNNPTFLEDLHLEGTFSIVIAGEFNAGKSTLINALLGKKILETGALPTTDCITIIASKSNTNQDENDDIDDIIESTAISGPTIGSLSSLDNNKNISSSSIQTPLGVVVHAVDDFPLLEDLTLIDSPGTNSTWMDHTERTLKLLPSADLILFVTSADRPFSDSERTLLQSIQHYRKSIVIVINKMDILDISGGDHGHEQKQEVIEFVTDKASELLGARPVVIPVSARDALSAKLMEKTTTSSATLPSQQQQQSSSSVLPTDRSSVWYRSNFASLESFLKDSLTTQTKLKSKLANPIGVTEGIMVECIQLLKQQQEEIKVDIATLNIFQNQFDGWKKELSSDLILSKKHMTDMIQQEGQRCDILLSRMNLYTFLNWALIDTKRLEEEWQNTKQEVSIHRQQDLKTDLLEQVQETADSVATRGRAQGQAVIEYLGKRPAMKSQSLVGSVTAASRFEDTRKNLVERLSTVINNILKGDSEDLDKDQLFQSMKQIAFLSASLQIGALSSGLMLASQSLDPLSGWISVISLAAGGGVSYTIGTRRIAKQYQQQWLQRAQRLDDAVEAISNKELERVNRRILDGVAPYTRFVESEQQRIDYLQEQCERIGSAARNLRNRISKL